MKKHKQLDNNNYDHLRDILSRKLHTQFTNKIGSFLNNKLFNCILTISLLPSKELIIYTVENEFKDYEET